MRETYWRELVVKFYPAYSGLFSLLQNIVWSYGLNRNVPVLNLTDGFRKAVMYTCSHVGVMYDFENNKQFILQGHVSILTAAAALLLLFKSNKDRQVHGTGGSM